MCCLLRNNRNGNSFVLRKCLNKRGVKICIIIQINVKFTILIYLEKCWNILIVKRFFLFFRNIKYLSYITMYAPNMIFSLFHVQSFYCNQ